MVESIEKVAVAIVTHPHLNPRKGHEDLELHKKLKGKNAVINLEGVPDGQCFN